MVVENWLLYKISDVFNRHEAEKPDFFAPESQQSINLEKIERDERKISQLAQFKSQGEWFGAIAALEKLLISMTNTPQSDKDRYQGLILSGPAAVLSHSALIPRFQSGIFTPEAFKPLALPPFRLPGDRQCQSEKIIRPITELPLLPNDPIASEQFCLVFTSSFGLVMVLGEDAQGNPAFQFSFEPEVILSSWELLRLRLLITNDRQLSRLDALVEQFVPPIPDYRIVMEFSRQLLKNIPTVSNSNPTKTSVKSSLSSPNYNDKASKIVTFSPQKVKRQAENCSYPTLKNCSLPLVEPSVTRRFPEIELLQALTHEIRTPLTTIRILTRLLLKRRDLSTEVIKRLELIDQECTEQINRMELIFQAAELETTSVKQKLVQLISIPLEQLLQQSIPNWKKQAQRRNVKLDVVLPKKLPKVISDPGMLEKVLTGLMENVTRSMPSGGEIRVEITTAGNQLKLQLQSQCASYQNPLKCIGQLLMFQPETGSLSLSLEVTKNLFQTLGGKMIVRQRPQQGEVLTIFLPLGGTQSEVHLSAKQLEVKF